MNGGYVMIKSTDSEIYSKVKKAIEIGKPILYYENDTTCYYIDSASIDGTDVVLTKGGKTITIDNDNNVVSSGDVANALMENIKDSNGNLRFIEGEGELETVSGFTFTYNKWSLSGSHLMLVVAGSVANATDIQTSTILAFFYLPQWILDKIYPIFSVRVSTDTQYFYADGGSSQYTSIRLIKESARLGIQLSPLTFTDDRSFRVQFDLLIDNE